MRVTTKNLISNFVFNTNRSLERIQDNQRQLTTGKKLFRPSDDPVAVTKSLMLRKNVADIEKYGSNTEESLGWLRVTESALMKIVEDLNFAKDMTVRAANDTFNGTDRAIFAQEVGLLIDDLIQAANSSYTGRYIFSGASTNSIPFDGSYSYLGTETAMVREVNKGINVTVNLTASDVFRLDRGGVYDEVNNSIITMLSDLQQILNQESQGFGRPPAGDIAAFIDQIDKALNNVVSLTAETGTKVKSLEELSYRHKDMALSATSLLSKIEDADVTKVITNLYAAESVYTAGMAAGARIMQTSLLNFLR